MELQVLVIELKVISKMQQVEKSKLFILNNMNWKIEKTGINQINNKGVKIQILEQPSYNNFFDEYDLYEWIGLLNIAMEESACVMSQGIVQLYYFNDLDWFDINVTGINFPEDYVMLRLTVPSLPPEENLMKKADFEKVLLEFSKKLLEIHCEDEKLPKEWSEKMRDGIEKLAHKIESYCVG